MRTGPTRLASRTGQARNRKPKILLAMNQNEPDLPGLGDWQRLDEVVADVSRLWWLKE
jgi:hypothetical protein